MSAHDTADLLIDLDALAANYAYFDSLTKGETAAAVKADAYGTGVKPAFEALWNAGCKTYFVATPDEGAELRALANEADAAAQIYVLNGVVSKDAAQFCVSQNLQPVLNSVQQTEVWKPFAQKSGGAALHIDTGMNRFGVTAEDAAALGPDGAAALNVNLVMSHLACASDPAHPQNESQRERFEAARALFPGYKTSLAASAGTLLGPPYHFDMTRIGIGLYGGGPMDAPHPDLKPVVTVTAPILQIRDVKAGEAVGYSATHICETDAKIAIIGAGYADGLLRSLSGQGAAYAQGQKLPFAGRVSMDLIALDITSAPDGLLRPGDSVELLGPNAEIDVVAGAAATISYELLTSLGHRYRRRYKKNSEIL